MRNIEILALGGIATDAISALYKTLAEPMGYRVATEPYIAGLVIGSTLVAVGVYKIVKVPKSKPVPELKNI